MIVELVGTGDIYSKYNSSCILINNNLIIDMPNGSFKELIKKGKNIASINTILVTHMHGDHIADIPFLLKYKSEKAKNNRTVIICPKGFRKNLELLFNVYNFDVVNKNVEYIELEVEENINIDKYNICNFFVKHCNLNAQGFVINGVLGITGDSVMCDGVKKIAKNSSFIICDSSMEFANEDHMGIPDIQYIASQYTNTVIATHMSDMSREKLIKLNTRNVIVPEDGYKINIEEAKV